MNATDDAAFQSALGALQAGRTNDAERQFRTILAGQPRHVGALNLLGILLTQLDRFAEAETCLRRALAEQPKSDATLYNYGLVLKALNRPGEAFESFSRALKINPSLAETWNNRGTVLNVLERYNEAIADFDRAIRLNPRYAEALCNKGKSLTLLRRFNEALPAFAGALALRPDLAEAWLGQGNILTELERHADALASYDKALASKSDHAEVAWFNRANSLWRLKRYDEALTAYDRALVLNPDLVGALLGRSNVFVALKRYEEALAAYDRAMTVTPDQPLAWLGRGRVFHELARHEEAIAAFDRALALKPDLTEAWANRGNVLAQLQRYGDALAAYDRAFAVKPDLAEAWLGRGNVFFKLRQWNDALAAYDKAVNVKSDLAETWVGRGSVLNEFERHDEALASYDRALSLNPDLATAWAGRGNVLSKLKRESDALAAYDRALGLDADLVEAWLGRGDVFFERGEYDKAVVAYSRALTLNPDAEYAAGIRLNARLQICDWSDLEAETARVLSTTREGNASSKPFVLLGIAATAADQLQCARRYMRDRPAFPPIWRGEVYSHDRIRLAYLSADLREHPVATLMAGVFEQHDRARFEVTALSLGVDDKSAFSARVRGSFERFVDVHPRSSQDIGDLVRQLEIDVLVDLNGFTQDGRPDILARRPAPIQVSYLGYLGTMGAEFIDYVIADRIVLPFDQQKHYAERIVHLPDCFLANDDHLEIAPVTPSRRDVGLPGDGFVFCSFNNSYKLGPPMFELWMRLLHAVKGSVLWLVESNQQMATNLRREAQRCGIDPTRIVFAPRIPFAAHLARQRLGGVFLDTTPYNAGATAAAALWSGVPVLTMLGDTFVGRMAASTLHAVGLPELVTDSLADYEALAIKIATEPTLCAALKYKLARNRDIQPLFDTARSTRHLEAAYWTMWRTYRRGRPPESFAVAIGT